MAILYTFTKTLDTHVISVPQITTYELYYISDKANTLISTAALAVNTPVTLGTTKDGQYRLILIVPAETNVEIEFDVIKYLQDSIIKETLNILCVLENGDCKDKFVADCLKKAGKQCLTHKSIFVKLHTFQALYIPTYGVNYSLIFAEFLENGAKTYNCKLQTTINAILTEECVTGSVKDVEKIFRLYVALYWAGMYFIEENLATGDADQLAFIKTKFCYDTIVACLCSTCIDIDVLKSLFSVDPTLTAYHVFQYDNIAYDINDIALLTPAYLDINAEETDEATLLAGSTFTFVRTARLGFVLTNTTPNKYSIYDILNNDITTTVFDRVYDTATLTEYYVSKEFYIPSDVYFKFLKN